MLDDTPNGTDLDWDDDGEDEMAYDGFMIQFCEERQKSSPEKANECVCGYHAFKEGEVDIIKFVERTTEDKAEIDRRLKARREVP